MPVNTRALVEEISKENQLANEVVECLQREVANAFVLYSNYKHYHWQTYGPLFRDMHLLFDELAKEALEAIDELAERVRMIGQDPLFDLTRIKETATVRPARARANLRDMVEEADANVLIVIKELREGAAAADDQDDPGTVDLLSKTVRVHEKHEWFLREILKKGDGLCM